MIENCTYEYLEQEIQSIHTVSQSLDDDDDDDVGHDVGDGDGDGDDDDDGR